MKQRSNSQYRMKIEEKSRNRNKKKRRTEATDGAEDFGDDNEKNEKK